MRECPYSTKTWEVLGNPSSPPSRFPSTLKISLGLRPRDNSWVLGNLSAIGDGLSTGKDFLIHNCRKIDDERICLCSREIHPLLLYEISHVSGNLVRFLNISLVLVDHGYIRVSLTYQFNTNSIGVTEFLRNQVSEYRIPDYYPNT